MDNLSKEGRWTILLGGNITPTTRLRRLVDGTRVVAADGGIRHAHALGLSPEMWIGDFDSADRDLQERNSHVPRQTHSAAKNATDGELAVAFAVSSGAKHLTLVGAFGGRADQATAHMLMALRMAQEGVETCLTSGTEEAFVVRPHWKAPGWPIGTSFSLLAFDDLTGVMIEGARWPLAGLRIGLGQTLGLSNVVSGELRLQVRAGRCLAIARLGKTAGRATGIDTIERATAGSP